MIIPIEIEDGPPNNYLKDTSEGMALMSSAIEEFKAKIAKLHAEKYQIYDPYNRGCIDGALLILNQMTLRAIAVYTNISNQGSDKVC